MRNPLSPRTRPPRPRLAQDARLIAVVIVAAAVMAGITTACSSSSSSSSSHASGQPSGQASSSGGSLAFSACMRSHGVPNFPDPVTGANGGAQVDITQGSGIDQNSPQYQSAMHACQSLLPAGKVNGGSVSPTVRTEYLRYAACMRSHGVPNYPDPTFSGNSVNLGNLSADGIDPNSPQYQSASNACASLNPMNHSGSSK